MITPDELTGTYVAEFRKEHGLSRTLVAALGGFTGKNGSRIWYIEQKNTWKPGEREKFMLVIARVLAGDITTPPSEEPTPAPQLSPSPPLPLPPPTVVIPAPSPVSVPAGLTMPEGWEELYPPKDPRHVHSYASTGFCKNSDCHAYQYASTPRANIVDVHIPEFIPLPPEVAPSASAILERPTLLIPDDGLHSFSNSELTNAWLRCQRKWWLSHYLKLRPREEDATSVRATGDRVHRALAAWYVAEGEVRVDPRDALERVIVEDWTALRTAAVQHGQADEWIENLAIQFQAANSLERAMVEGYMEWLQETGADSNFQVVGSEMGLSAEIDVPSEDGTYTKRIRLIGKLDSRVVRDSDGVRLLIDHKTVGNLTEPLRTLHMNPQMKTYHLLEWLGTAEGEARCDGALYNMLRRCKRTIRATPPFYARVPVRNNPIELETFKRHIITTARQVLRAEAMLNAGVDHQNVVPANRTATCAHDCDFFRICHMFDDGSRVEDAITNLYVRHDPLGRYEGLTVQRQV